MCFQIACEIKFDNTNKFSLPYLHPFSFFDTQHQIVAHIKAHPKFDLLSLVVGDGTMIVNVSESDEKIM